jgi:hypothetical protein
MKRVNHRTFMGSIYSFIMLHRWKMILVILPLETLREQAARVHLTHVKQK